MTRLYNIGELHDCLRFPSGTMGLHELLRSYEDAINSIERYLTHGVTPGGQLEAMLENDLREAFGRADAERRHVIFPILIYLWNDVPAAAWGSKERVNAWVGMDRAERARVLDARKHPGGGAVVDRDGGT